MLVRAVAYEEAGIATIYAVHMERSPRPRAEREDDHL